MGSLGASIPPETFSTSNFLFFVFGVFFFFGCTRSIWKFPGQGSNPHCHGDNARSLTHCATAGTPSSDNQSERSPQKPQPPLTCPVWEEKRSRHRELPPQQPEEATSLANCCQGQVGSEEENLTCVPWFRRPKASSCFRDGFAN